MKPTIVVLDTSMLTVHLRVPGHASCGPQNDKWSYERIEAHLGKRIKQASFLVLPLAVIIETAAHIANAGKHRYDLATKLVQRVSDAIEGKTPWLTFGDQAGLWEPAALQKVLDRWPVLASQGISLADDTIREVADFYSRLGHPVEILTGDQGLKAMEPAPSEPRRRRKQPSKPQK